VSIQAVTPEIARSFGLKEPQGVLVSDVVMGGPAYTSGIKRGDIIVSFSGKEIKNVLDLPRTVAETPVGKEVEVKVIRDGKAMNFKISVAELTDQRAASQMQAPQEDIGINVNDITPHLRNELGITDKSGVLVINVELGSPAESAGIQAGDVIKEVNHKPVRNVKEYFSAAADIQKGVPFLLLIKRGGRTFYVSIAIS
jgi:serine protease Do